LNRLIFAIGNRENRNDRWREKSNIHGSDLLSSAISRRIVFDVSQVKIAVSPAWDAWAIAWDAWAIGGKGAKMSDGLAIIWAAPREVSAAEKRLIASAAREADARVRTVSMSSLASELAPSISQGPVVVVVGSRKDAETARHLGADEVVHVVRSVTLRKSTIGGAIARARARARRRTALAGKSTDRRLAGDAFLIRVLEQRLGSPLNAATTKCMGLADELKGAVAAADHLMQRVQRGAQRKGSERWRGDVRDYARATLKAKALAVELEKQVGVTDGVVKALDSLSLHIETTETDAALVLVQLADFLRECLPAGATLEVDAPGPCVVGVPRTVVVAMLSAAIESALFNLYEGGSAGRISLRSSMTSKKEIVVEIADDGAPAAALLRASSKNPSFSDSCAIRLRQLRKRARRAGGEMTISSDASGNLLTLYLPSPSETAMTSSLDGSLRARSRRALRAPPSRGGREGA
jgi:hypothetical protein